ncbi:MAG: efflux RND transporter periplasmic adaptor subunit [Bacteroidales bacterium]|nr:efflux RND transporter periplasmic adaptor subunit [Bacteroidales bacterium]
MSPKFKKTLIIVAGAIVLVAGGFLLISKKSESAILAETTQVKKGEILSVVTATGTIEPINLVEVGTQVSGVVEKIYVDFNSEVKENQLIAELDKTNLLTALVQSQALYENSQNDYEYQESIYNRQNQLYQKGMITQTEYEQALYAYKNAKGIVKQRKSDLDKAKTNLSYADIYSPIAGVVLSRSVDEGQTVAASLNTPTLFTIARDLREMQVEADVDEADIGQVIEGQRVTFTVDAYQGMEFAGKVSQVRLNPTVTSNVVTYTVVVSADNQALKLKPGMTATISIYTQELKDVLVAEMKSFHFNQDDPLYEKYRQQHESGKPLPPTTMEHPDLESELNANERIVFVVKDNSIRPQKVEVGSSDGVNIQIISGLDAGDSLVYQLKEAGETKLKQAQSSPFLPTPPGKKK